MYFRKIISFITLLLVVNPHALPVDIDISINPIPVRDHVKEVYVVATKTNVSKNFKIVVNISYFTYFFFDLRFLSLR